MRKGQVFWGVFFITFGLAFLLERFGIIKFEYNYLFNVWPLYLIVLGVSFLSLSKNLKLILSAIAAIILTLFLIGLLSRVWHPFNFISNHHGCYVSSNDNYTKRDSIIESFDSLYKYSTLNLNASALTIETKDSCNDLVKIYNNGFYRELNYNKSVKDSSIEMNIDFNNDKINFQNKHSKNKMLIFLNQYSIWDLNMDIGASRFNSDLSQYKIHSINIDAGAAAVWLKVGELLDSTFINIDAGASTINIEIPYNSGCQINVNTGLSSKSFEGFTETSEDVYETKNYNNASKKILINLDGGISSFNIRRK